MSPLFLQNRFLRFINKFLIGKFRAHTHIMSRQAPGIADYVIMTINYLSLCDLGYITNGALPTFIFN